MALNSIKVKNYSDVFEEYEAAAAIVPGYLLELTSADKVQAHSSAGGNTLPMFALEDELQGNGINDSYAADDQVQVWIPGRGDIVYGILADGNDGAIGAYVESNGDGKLRVHAPDTASSQEAITVYAHAIVGQVVEDCDLSDSSGAESSGVLGYDKRVKVRII